MTSNALDASPMANRAPPTQSADADNFRRLAAQWVSERPDGVKLSVMTNTPAYRAIIAMGLPAVPLILAELSRELDHWFPALMAITGENPVTLEAQGKLPLMARDWLRWGHAQGYIGDVD